MSSGGQESESEKIKNWPKPTSKTWTEPCKNYSISDLYKRSTAPEYIRKEFALVSVKYTFLKLNFKIRQIFTFLLINHSNFPGSVLKVSKRKGQRMPCSDSLRTFSCILIFENTTWLALGHCRVYKNNRLNNKGWIDFYAQWLRGRLEVVSSNLTEVKTLSILSYFSFYKNLLVFRRIYIVSDNFSISLLQ